jgi:hypothetical protein
MEILLLIWMTIHRLGVMLDQALPPPPRYPAPNLDPDPEPGYTVVVPAKRKARAGATPTTTGGDVYVPSLNNAGSGGGDTIMASDDATMNEKHGGPPPSYAATLRHERLHKSFASLQRFIPAYRRAAHSPHGADPFAAHLVWCHLYEEWERKIDQGAAARSWAFITGVAAASQPGGFLPHEKELLDSRFGAAQKKFEREMERVLSLQQPAQAEKM